MRKTGISPSSYTSYSSTTSSPPTIVQVAWPSPSHIFNAMHASIPDVEMADAPSLDASSTPSLLLTEHSDDGISAVNNLLPENTFAQSQPQLIPLFPADATTHHGNNGVPIQQLSYFDPRALLNPKSSNSKRPASASGETDPGRADPTVAGQVSLVERLHNVQERTSSPAKRVKTDDPHKTASSSSKFGGGSALELQHLNGQQLPPSQGPQIDLTMSV